MNFSKHVITHMRTTSAAFSKGLLFTPKYQSSSRDLSKLTQPSNTLYRGITRSELDTMLASSQVPTFTEETDDDIGRCDYAKQIMEGQGGLLSTSNCLETANMYGANRSFVPGDGAIIIMGMPAFYVPISEHIRLCPQLCFNYQQKMMKIASGGSFTGDGSATVSVPDVVRLSIGVNEIAVVVGRHKGVDFANALDVNMSVYSITHVIGSGRGILVDCQTCVIDTYVNPDYSQRALSCEITLTSNPQHLDVLEKQMICAGSLEKGQKLITPDDAALIQSDEELNLYLTSPAGPNGPIILKSIPKDIHGDDVVPYLRDLLSSTAVLEAGAEAGPRRRGR